MLIAFILASFGGILGLLLGFSFVAGFELIYFFTIRIIFDRITNKEKANENQTIRYGRQKAKRSLD